jgi:hypothetical protein
MNGHLVDPWVFLLCGFLFIGIARMLPKADVAFRTRVKPGDGAGTKGNPYYWKYRR